MVAPEVLVVVELRLGGARVLAAKHPHLPAGLGGHRGLVGTPGRRTSWGYHLEDETEVCCLVLNF